MASTSGNHPSGPYRLPVEQYAVPQKVTWVTIENINSIISLNFVSFLLTNFGAFIVSNQPWVGVGTFLAGIICYWQYVYNKLKRWEDEAKPLDRVGVGDSSRTGNSPPDYSV